MKDQQRIEVVQALMDARLTVAQAAQVMGRSERQVWRLLARARDEGLAGLLHGNRGRAPAHRSDDRFWQRVLKLAAEKYQGVNDRHLQELLAREHSIHVCRESLRKRLRGAGIAPKRSRRPRKYRGRRERRAAAGMLLQIDASPHDWLEGRGPSLTLVGAIDDATNQAWVRFSEAETTWAYLELMRRIALSAGLPLSLYSDRHDIFHARREPTLAEQLQNARPLTQFGRAMGELGVSIIPAYSPQAKGRIERLWGVLQDRLVVELRLAGVTTLGQANALLDRYLPAHNRRFAVAPREQAAVWRPAPDARRLDRVLCLKEQRVVGRDHVVSFAGLSLQVPRSRKFFSLAGRRVDVLQLRDRSIEVHHGGEAVARFSHEQVKALAKRRSRAKSQPSARV
ncbi:MAG: ISNCY family transposase [Acidobacteria bacterium]|nr:ISNCY family transposase [Acidobacteriota bacterium]